MRTQIWEKSIGNTDDIGITIDEDRHIDGQMQWDLLWDLPHVIMVTKKPLCLPSAARELRDSECNSWSSNHIKTGKGRLWGDRGIPSLSPKVYPQTKSISIWGEEGRCSGSGRARRCTLWGLASKWVINKIPFLLVWASILSISKILFYDYSDESNNFKWLSVLGYYCFRKRKLGNNLFAGKPCSQLALLTCHHRY